MPTVHIIHSIKIDLYSRDHLPPHFHARYAEHEALIEIQTLATYAGYLPPKQQKMVMEWAGNPKITAWLLANFNRLNPNLRT